MGEASSESASRRETLRKHFAIEEDKVVDTEYLASWLMELATLLTKKDIHENAMALATYMVEVKGYTTGEDLLDVVSGDIEDAREACSLTLTDVSVRAIMRYMEREKVTGDQKQGQSSPASKAYSAQSGAEAALLKIANTTAVKMPSIKEKYLTVKIAMQYVKKFAQAKKYAYEPTGLYDALTSVRKNAGMIYADLVRVADDYVTEPTMNVEELAEFLQEISDEVCQLAELDQADNIVEAAAKLVAKSTKKTFDQLRLQMHKCLESPGQVTSGQFLKQDFAEWENNLTEIRYNDMVTDEAVCEALQHFLAKFQPLVHKVRDAYKEAEGKQSRIDKMVKTVRTDIPKLEAKSLLDKSKTMGGKGKGKGKGGKEQ